MNNIVNLVMHDLQGGYMNVDWSPDGSKIAVGDYNDIFLVNPDGAGLQTLRKANWTKGTFYNTPYWTPDGKYLAYTLRKSSGDYIAKYTLSTGTEAQLTSGRFTLGCSAE